MAHPCKRITHALPQSISGLIGQRRRRVISRFEYMCQMNFSIKTSLLSPLIETRNLLPTGRGIPRNNSASLGSGATLFLVSKRLWQDLRAEMFEVTAPRQHSIPLGQRPMSMPVVVNARLDFLVKILSNSRKAGR